MAVNISVCTVCPELAEKLKKFKFRKETTNAALVLKIDKKQMMVVLDEELEDLDIDDLQTELPESQPRYVVISYKYKMKDGRVSYPLCFVFVSPQGCQPDLTMMYSGSQQEAVRVADVTKVFEVRSLEDLTEEFLLQKLSFFS